MQAEATVAPGALEPPDIDTIAPGYQPPADSGAAPQINPDLPKRLGNYELLKKIGQGGMGSVYLARQLSLDCDVAVKLLAADLAGDEEFVARFTREAYAAAQLSHHNVVQVFDIGAQKPHHYFSMEFVTGSNLGKTAREQGQLPPAEAVGLILQAARGLRYAHEMGLVHRDVKPENLLLNDEGIVKVADLGLAKRVGEKEPGRAGSPGEATRTLVQQRRDVHTTKLDSASAASATQLSVAMGTPAYMAPEQALDAANVDQRADIYALGCSLYHLLVGRPPFEGDTAEQVMQSHLNAEPIPPQRVAETVPGSLGQIVVKMMAKRPEDRPQTMRETTRLLEQWLEEFEGIGITPTGDAEKTMAAAAGRYVSASMKSVRAWSIVGFYLLCVVAALLFAIFVENPVNKVGLAGACAGLAVSTTLSYLVYAGIRQRTHVWSRLRQLLTDGGLLDALGLLVFGVLLVVVLVALNLHWWWLGAAVLGVGLAVGFYHAVDVSLAQQRQVPLHSIKLLLRRLRKEGYDENAIQHFVATKAGEHWEELYEELFGFDEKIEARPVFGRDGGKDRPRFGTWREPLLAWIDRRLEYKRRRRDEAMLIAVEKMRLRSKGIGEAVAEKQARANALRFADLAQNFRAEAEDKAKPTVPKPRTAEPEEEPEQPQPQTPGTGTGTGSDAIEKRKVVYDDGKTNRVHESWFQRRFGSPLDIVLGPGLRVILALTLFGCFALIAGQMLETNAGESVFDGIDLANAPVSYVATLFPQPVAERVFHWNSGIAGLILLTSMVFNTRRFAVLTLIAAFMTIFLRGMVVPGTEFTIQWWIAAGVGGAIYLIALVFFRTDEGF